MVSIDNLIKGATSCDSGAHHRPGRLQSPQRGPETQDLQPTKAPTDFAEALLGQHPLSFRGSYGKNHRSISKLAVCAGSPEADYGERGRARAPLNHRPQTVSDSRSIAFEQA